MKKPSVVFAALFLLFGLCCIAASFFMPEDAGWLRMLGSVVIVVGPYLVYIIVEFR